jgi:hypothetical protein
MYQDIDIVILNDLTLDMIDKLIINNELKIENKEILLCNWCNKKYKWLKKLNSVLLSDK